MSRRIASLSLALIATVTLVACGSASNTPLSRSGTRYADSSTGVEVRIPHGWHLIARLSDYIYPTQILAAASYPVSVPLHPHTCFPTAALRQMPKGGVLVRIIDYTRQAASGKVIRRPHFAPRPTSFRYSEATHRRFECAGPSYRFVWAENGRAFAALVWFDPRTVSPSNRAEALGVLNSFRATSATPPALRHSR